MRDDSLGLAGLGHQIRSDHVRCMLGAMDRHGISVPDRQLACAPVRSSEGEAYLSAMLAAANYGRANRQLLTHAAREAFARTTGERDLRLLYDVSHNLAKLEQHRIAGEDRRLCVHRKGATRALPPRHPDSAAAGVACQRVMSGPPLGPLELFLHIGLGEQASQAAGLEVQPRRVAAA